MIADCRLQVRAGHRRWMKWVALVCDCREPQRTRCRSWVGYRSGIQVSEECTRRSYSDVSTCRWARTTWCVQRGQAPAQVTELLQAAKLQVTGTGAHWYRLVWAGAVRGDLSRCRRIGSGRTQCTGVERECVLGGRPDASSLSLPLAQSLHFPSRPLHDLKDSQRRGT